MREDLVLVFIGTWLIQDALASIAFYPKEQWFWNHIARLVRLGMGVALIVMAVNL